MTFIFSIFVKILPLLFCSMQYCRKIKKRNYRQEITPFFFPDILSFYKFYPIFIYLFVFHHLSNVNHQRQLTPFRNRDKELRKKYYSSQLTHLPCEQKWVVTYFSPSPYCTTSSTNRENKNTKKIRNPLSSKSVAYAFRNRFEFQENEGERASLGLLPV